MASDNVRKCSDSIFKIYDWMENIFIELTVTKYLSNSKQVHESPLCLLIPVVFPA